MINAAKALVRPFIVALFLLGAASAAQAQATRTWVSGVGDDVNPCSRTAPCKTYAGAISKTARNGVISTLDPGGFGAVTITKSITIEGTGTNGSILSAGTNGVIINITDPADTKKAVVLRNISIDGAGTGLNGIRVISNAFVVIDGVKVRDVTGNGLDVTLPAGTVARIATRNFTVDRSLNAIAINAAGNGVSLDVDDSLLSNSTRGIYSVSNGIVTVRRSSIVNHGNAGIEMFSSTSEARVFVVDSLISNSYVALYGNGSGARITASGSTLTGNVAAFLVAGGGQIASYGDNLASGNSSNTLPTGSVGKL